MRKHIVIPDTQVKPDVPTDHLGWIGKYIVEQQPDVVVHLGDHADMPSLSSYDRGKKSFEGRRYKADVMAAWAGMDTLMQPIHEHNAKLRQWKMKQWQPELHFTLGNHEHRIDRAIELQAEYDGILSTDDLGYQGHGWEVHPFQKPVEIDGVHYCHYFYQVLSGRPFGGTIDNRLNKLKFSFIQGHEQVFLYGEQPLNNGGFIQGCVWGNCYLHDEQYRGFQANGERRGILVLHEVADGRYDPMVVSLDYLCRKYEGMHLHKFMQQKYPEIYGESVWLQFQADRYGRAG